MRGVPIVFVRQPKGVTVKKYLPHTLRVIGIPRPCRQKNIASASPQRSALEIKQIGGLDSVSFCTCLSSCLLFCRPRTMEDA
jgi:hypothetical protein